MTRSPQGVSGFYFYFSSPAAPPLVYRHRSTRTLPVGARAVGAAGETAGPRGRCGSGCEGRGGARPQAAQPTLRPGSPEAPQCWNYSGLKNVPPLTINTRLFPGSWGGRGSAHPTMWVGASSPEPPVQASCPCSLGPDFTLRLCLFHFTVFIGASR